MRISHYSILVVLMSGCTADNVNKQSYSSFGINDVPVWVVNPPERMVSACSRIKNHDVVTAKKVAIAKAQADYLARSSVTIIAQTDIKEKVKSTGDTSISDISYQQRIHLQAQGEVTQELQVLNEQMVHTENFDQWCVLMGMSKGGL